MNVGESRRISTAVLLIPVLSRNPVDVTSLAGAPNPPRFYTVPIVQERSYRVNLSDILQDSRLT